MKSLYPTYQLSNFNTYKKEGILASKFGVYLAENPHFFKPHKHDFYHLLLFTAGKGKHQLDFKYFDIEPGSMYFMAPGQVHTWEFSEQPDGYLVNFSVDYFNGLLANPAYLSMLPFFSSNLQQQVFQLNLETQHKLIALFEEIFNLEHNLSYKYGDDFVRINLLKIFMYIAQFTDSVTTSQNDPYNHTLLNNFKNLIEVHFREIKLPKDYAAKLFITPNHLNAVCSTYLKQSAGEIIRERVLLEAKRMLMNFDLRISEIAENLGFNDQSYFIRFFKKHENISPEKFRNQYRYDK
ncbi:MAG: AraC family transcriptional regulator [Pedobacter sp.]|nr:MAG: AraC family transcriptional regulator [Pedobacter sp.]